MIYSRYGISLERLTEDRIEMVRKWRNQDFVRSKMQYQQKITKEEQKIWFDQLHCENDWYFIAVHEKYPFSLFHIKNINWVTRCGEAGGFVAEIDFQGKPETGFAILALMDFAFYGLGLKILEAKYNSSIKSLQELNHQLGYKLVQDMKNGFIRARVSPNQYEVKAGPFLKAAKRIKGSHSILSEPSEWLIEHLQQYGDREALGLDPK